MDDLDITKEFNKFSYSINMLATASTELKNQIDAVVTDLATRLVEIKKEESEKANLEIADLSAKINSEKDLLAKFIGNTVSEITNYNETIKAQIEEIRVISQGISEDSASKFSKALDTFDDKMKALDEQIQKVYTAGLKSDFDTLSRDFTDLERSYSSLATTVQGSFIQPITEIKNDLKNLEIKIDNSFNNANNNINNKFDNVLNKLELLSKDEVTTNEKANALIQKSENILQKSDLNNKSINNILQKADTVIEKVDSNSRKINVAIVLSGLAFILALVAMIMIIIK